MSIRPTSLLRWLMQAKRETGLLELTPIKELLSQARNALTDSDTAQLDAELLLSHQLNKSRTWLHTWPDELIAKESARAFNQLILRRQNGEPIAHIIGKQSFWSLELKVTAETLIPRPDTELLVEEALSTIPDDHPCTIADLGTGSGAIALAIASERPNALITATDQSEAALQIAAENAAAHQLSNVTFKQGSWFEPLQQQPFDLILSNPPYIAEGDPHLSQGDVRFDPDSALSSGSSGLDDLQQIISEAPQHLKTEGRLIVEHGYDQGKAVRSLFEQHHYRTVTTRRDLAGAERISYGICP
jgi:release factor glutamine methyltransferase